MNKEVIEITEQQAKDLVENYKGGRFFTVTFVKRTNNEVRVMNCRKGVKKHLKGGVKKYDPAKHNLVCVYDIQSKGYRSINLDSIKTVDMDNKVYTVKR